MGRRLVSEAAFLPSTSIDALVRPVAVGSACRTGRWSSTTASPKHDLFGTAICAAPPEFHQPLAVSLQSDSPMGRVWGFQVPCGSLPALRQWVLVGIGRRSDPLALLRSVSNDPPFTEPRSSGLGVQWEMQQIPKRRPRGPQRKEGGIQWSVVQQRLSDLN